MPVKRNQKDSWERLVTPPEKVLSRIRPGMRIFMSTGLAEPRSFVKALMSTSTANLR